MKDIKFILVDDNKEFRQGLKALLETEFSAQVIAEASNGDEFLKLSNHHLADIIIMDLMMPEKDGIEATRPFIWNSPHAKVIAVTMHGDKAYLQQLIETGFKGCIFKNNIFTEISYAVNQVMNGKLYFPENMKIK